MALLGYVGLRKALRAVIRMRAGQVGPSETGEQPDPSGLSEVSQGASGKPGRGKPRGGGVYHCSTYFKSVRVGGWGIVSGGHVLRETTSRGLCGLVCPSRTIGRGGKGDCVKEEGEKRGSDNDDPIYGIIYRR
jgi:hypothetical protein